MRKLNIYHRKDNRWEGRIPRGKLENGKRKFQYVLGRTKEAVEQEMTRIYEKEHQESHCSRTVSELFQEWHSSILYRVKESTAANYMMKASRHILPMFGDKRADMLVQGDIYQFISEKQKEGLSNRYITDIIILMKSLFKYAVRTYHIINPLEGIIMPKKKKTEIQLLDEAEQNILQQYIAENQNQTTLGIALSMSTGIRMESFVLCSGGILTLKNVF